jgi:hypothetical protein
VSPVMTDSIEFFLGYASQTSIPNRSEPKLSSPFLQPPVAN